MIKRRLSVLALVLAFLLCVETGVLYADDGTGTDPAEGAAAATETVTETEAGTEDGSSAEQAEESVAVPAEEETVSITKAKITGVKDKTYTGKARTQTLTVTYDGKTLTKGSDYTVSYKDNKEIGTASVTVKGKGRFTGSVKLRFKILDTVSKTIATSSTTSLAFKTAVREHVLLGSMSQPQWLRLSARTNNTLYLRWEDCKANGGALEGYIVLRKTDETGTYKEIARVSAGTSHYIDQNIKKNTKYHYTVVGYKKFDSETLTRSKTAPKVIGTRFDSFQKTTYGPNEYDLSPLAKMKPSSASLTVDQSVQMSLVYPSTAATTWTRWRSSDSSVASVDEEGVVTGKKLGTVTITATTPSGWDVKATVKVKRSIAGADVRGIKDKVYSGRAKTQTVTVYYDGQKLTENKDYKVSYKNNKKIGKASMTISGIGRFAGEKTIPFKILDSTGKTVRLSSGSTLIFKSAMLQHTRLSSKARPKWLRLTGKSDKTLYLTWNDCASNGGSIDGYIVLRRAGKKGAYKEIAKVSSSVCQYTDKKVKKNVRYYYLVVGYKNTARGLKMSKTSLKAAGVRADSAKKNAYAKNSDGLKPVVKLNKTSVTVYADDTIKLKVRYPAKAFSKWTRWRSGNSNIAVVSSNGKVTGKGAGTTTIYARTPGGWDVKCKVTVKGNSYENYLRKQGFPKTYWPALKKLHLAHPSWIFVAKKTGMTFDTAVAKEYNSGSNYMSTNEYNISHASERALRYYMDPRNFLKEKYVFQFMDHRYRKYAGSRAAVKRLVSTNPDCFMNNKSFIDLLYQSGKDAGVAAPVLVSMIVQEHGWTGGSDLITGKYTGTIPQKKGVYKLKGYYNYFNIGAYYGVIYARSLPSYKANATRHGLWWAAGEPSYTGKVTKTTFSRPWNTKTKAIKGAAQWYKYYYINEGQDTFYTKKFNVMNGVDNVAEHQYETPIYGARDEGVLLSKAYNSNSKNLRFLIPVYKNIDKEKQVKSY